MRTPDARTPARRALRRKGTRPAVAALLVGALALAIAACGEKDESTTATEPEQLDLALDFLPNADHVGFYETLAKGYFGDAGLDVTPRSPTDPALPIKQVAAGNADLAISYEPEVLLAREQGLDVVAVAAIAQRPLTSLISLPDAEIEDVADLRGKTIATAGIPYQEAYLRSILSGAGLSLDDVKVVNVQTALSQALLSGNADAVLGAFWNVEGVTLQERGEDPRIQPVDELGVPTYDELVLVASREQVESDPESIRLFLDALARGTGDAEANPAEGIRALREADDVLDPKFLGPQVKATLPVLVPAGDQPFGFMDPAQWREYAGWMHDEDLVSELPDVDAALTNELLSGEGVPEG